MPLFSASSPQIAVIGAGLAGLTAAYRLDQAGHDVMVYEARNRVGGRVLSITLDGYTAELGGENFLDGGQALHSKALIQEFGLETISGTRLRGNRTVINGSDEYNVNRAIQAYGFTPESLAQRIDQARAHAHSMHDILISVLGDNPQLYALFSLMLTGYEGGSPKDLSPRYSTTFYHMMLGGICAAHPGNESDILEWEYLFIKDGNESLAQAVAARLNQPVKLLHQITHVAKTDSGNYSMTFSNGNTAAADIVILAIPGSTYHTISFENNVIPRQTLDAIQNIHYGQHAKILVASPRAFPGLIACFNENTVSFTSRDHIITLYYGGDYSRFTAQNLSTLFDENKALFQIVYGFRPALPTLATDTAHGQYHGSVGYSWSDDPYAQGSYSYIAAGQEKLLTSLETYAGEEVRSLFRPLNNNTLFFAGEHATTLLGVSGTIEAAIESGERAARIISNTMNSTQK